MHVQTSSGAVALPTRNDGIHEEAITSPSFASAQLFASTSNPTAQPPQLSAQLSCDPAVISAHSTQSLIVDPMIQGSRVSDTRRAVVPGQIAASPPAPPSDADAAT